MVRLRVKDNIIFCDASVCLCETVDFASHEVFSIKQNNRALFSAIKCGFTLLGESPGTLRLRTDHLVSEL